MTDDDVIEAWQRNAAPWTTAVRAGTIESRRRVTDDAVLAATLALGPGRVLDLGCGEGWLARRLGEAGLTVTGVDAVPALVDAARALDPDGDYRVATFGDVAGGIVRRRFDIAVCNFSLIGRHDVEALVQAMPRLLEPGGHLVVQTLYPESAGDADGWRPGCWDDIPGDFSAPAPWYRRSRASWHRLLSGANLILASERAPRHPDTAAPLSLLLVTRLAARPAP